MNGERLGSERAKFGVPPHSEVKRPGRTGQRPTPVAASLPAAGEPQQDLAALIEQPEKYGSFLAHPSIHPSYLPAVEGRRPYQGTGLGRKCPPTAPASPEMPAKGPKNVVGATFVAAGSGASLRNLACGAS